jgi:hypothetical protein
MGELILAILEPVLEMAGEWLTLQFCNLLIDCWHALQSAFVQAFF